MLCVLDSYLLPEKNKSNKQKSAVVKRNCNPTWNHVFLFEDVSLEEMKDRSLELTVWDYDKITSNDFLGGVRLNIGTGTTNLLHLTVLQVGSTHALRKVDYRIAVTLPMWR